MIEITFRATSEKLWPAACSTLAGPRNSSAQNSAKNVSIAARTSGVRRSPRAAGLGRVESGRSVLDRIHPVTGDGLSDRKCRPRQRLGRQPFDRIAVDGLDFPGGAAHGYLPSGPPALLKALTKINPGPLSARHPASYILPVGRSGEVRRPGAAVWVRGSDA